MSFDYLFSYFGSLTVLIPFICCLLARKKKDKVVNTIWILLGIDIVIAIITEFYNQAGSSNSFLYVNLYTLLEFFMISLVYTSLLPQWKRWIYTIIVLYTIFFVINSLFFESIRVMQNYPMVVESIIVVTYSGFHYRHIRNTIEREPPLFSYGPFWINTAFALYFFFSIGLFVMANHILTELEPATARMIWNVHGLNYIVKNIFLAVGIRHIHKAEDEEFPYELFGEDKNWRQRMPPNPNLDNPEDTTEEDKE